jgi:hypothetical protein
MWEPRRLTTPWASAACYKDNFTLSFILLSFSGSKSKTRKLQAEFSELYEISDLVERIERESLVGIGACVTRVSETRMVKKIFTK